MGALIVCNPGNPSGRVYPKEVLNRLVEMTAPHNCYLIFDEIYADLVWTELTGKEFYSPCQDALHKHVLCCRGFSKNVACQSWRVGYVIGHPDTIAEAMNEHDPIYISVPILQHAVARFLNDHLEEYKAHIKAANAMMMRNLAMLSTALEKSMGWRYCAPEGSMYAMFRHSEATDMDAVVAGVKKGVGVAGGSMFFEGNPACSGFIRIHVGLDEERVKKICKSLEEATPQP
jgi:aspartate aminotransferase